MKTFQVQSLIQTVFSVLGIPARNRIWLFRALSPGVFAIFFAFGCANTSSLQRPLVSRGNKSIAASRSDKTQAEVQSKGLGSARIVKSSWYGPGYEGKRTSSGEPFDPNRLTAASRTLPLGSIVRVTNLRNGRSVEVKVNDRGPRVGSRGLDLSPAAARKIGLTHPGLARVKITPVTHTTTE
jgi:rare lipoprotein A (peptidoglycan hydrolase)